MALHFIPCCLVTIKSIGFKYVMVFNRTNTDISDKVKGLPLKYNAMKVKKYQFEVNFPDESQKVEKVLDLTPKYYFIFYLFSYFIKSEK